MTISRRAYRIVSSCSHLSGAHDNAAIPEADRVGNILRRDAERYCLVPKAFNGSTSSPAWCILAESSDRQPLFESATER